MQGDSGLALSSLLVDGGMSGNNLLMQIQADLLGIPILRPAMAEATALGAAIAGQLRPNAQTLILEFIAVFFINVLPLARFVGGRNNSRI
jgi:glycerol kinase